MKIMLRLISPTNRRIVYIDRANPKHALTLLQLAKLDWREYSGPAMTDANGWVIPETDPTLTVTPWVPLNLRAKSNRG